MFFFFTAVLPPISFETYSFQYTDSLKISPPISIHKYKFLRTWVLRAGNTEHDGLYKAAKSDFESFVESTSKEIVESVDDTIPELPLKDLVCVLLAFSFSPSSHSSCVGNYVVLLSCWISRLADFATYQTLSIQQRFELATSI